MINQNIVLEKNHKGTGLKLFLALMEDTHIQHLIKLAKNPDLIDLMGWNIDFEADNIEKFIETITYYGFPYSRKSQPILFGIYLNLNNLPIGYVVLKGFNMELLTAEIGIAILDPKYSKKGYGKLATIRTIDYAFNDLLLQKIGAVIMSSNKISINLSQKLGFETRNILYNSWKITNNQLVDMLLIELTKEKWAYINSKNK